jgi:tetratricopeptide (TPR) repeat protein
MSAKAKKHGKQTPADELFRRAQREFEKGDFRQALKEAKVCYRQAPSEEHRRLLERAWLARVRMLDRAGLSAEARAAAQELLDFGVTDATAQKELPEVLMAVGLFDRFAADAQRAAAGSEAKTPMEIEPRLLATAADRAVLAPDQTPASLSELRPVAVNVRAALDRLHAGDEAQALAALQDIPRSSPFADWKLFVRGLAAYYRHDFDQMRANWERLTPNRLAARIAAPLRRLAQSPTAPEQGDDSAEQGIHLLEEGLFGERVTARLQRLQEDLTQDHWRQFLQRLRHWRQAIRRMAPELLQRVDRLLYGEAIRKKQPRRLEELVPLLDPPPMDPNWNRARALVWEQASEDIEDAERHWLAYLNDLAQLPDLSPSERDLAQALVWTRLGQRWADESPDREAFEEDAKIDAEDMAIQDRAIEYLNRAIALAPDLPGAYYSLAVAFDAWGQDGHAAETYCNLLERSPDQLDAITYLFYYHASRDEMLLARDYALRAQRLMPTSENTRKMVRRGHLGAARELAFQTRWEEGRAELAAEHLCNPVDIPFLVSVHKAVFEFKAGDPEAGRRWMDEALATGADPAAVLLTLTIEAERYRLPRPVDGIAAEVEHRWSVSLKGKKRSAAAGQMASVMTDYFVSKPEDADYEPHTERVLEYLRGCTRVRWEASDLSAVCVFVESAVFDEGFSDDEGLLRRLAQRGRKSFPHEPVFSLILGNLELDKGPFYCDRRFAKQCFEQALQAARASHSPSHAKLAEAAERKLTFLNEVGTESVPLPFGGPAAFYDEDETDDAEFMFAGLPEELQGIFSQMCDSMGMDPTEVIQRIAAGEFPAPDFAPPHQKQPAKSKQAKKKKKRRG